MLTVKFDNFVRVAAAALCICITGACDEETAVFCCCYWDGPWWGCACAG